MAKTETNSDLEKLGKLIRDQKVAMLTTTEEDGTLRSRPMFTQQLAFDGSLWFFTGMDTSKVHEIEQEQHVNVSYSDADKNHYVSVSGTATVLRDRKKSEQLWNPLYKAWFPEGLDDPNLALMKIDVLKAEYWDAPNGKMVQLAGFVKAIATGQPYSEKGQHGEIRLNRQ